jgi:hypothetical protein
MRPALWNLDEAELPEDRHDLARLEDRNFAHVSHEQGDALPHRVTWRSPRTAQAEHEIMAVENLSAAATMDSP